MQQLQLGDMTIDVVQKSIKNVHLSVYPPSGRVRIAAPLYMDIDTIRIYAISKLTWIKRQQQKFNEQERESVRDFITQESHYYMGKRYLLRVIFHTAAPKVVLRHNRIELHIRENTSREQREHILNEWYRQRLKDVIPGYISKWEQIMKVRVEEFGIKKMKTKWGTCNSEAKRIWLNLELAKKPPQCLEYIIVHEMVHLQERHHNDRFISLMDTFLPQWRFYKEELKLLPVSHAEWSY
ncbi:MAG: SprT family zinc-dependent metalloprotease [Bacteroidetes bacterium]|nr:SprT family zinc-dependent metalloprotease [Bacteroidota bacterium]